MSLVSQPHPSNESTVPPRKPPVGWRSQLPLYAALALLASGGFGMGYLLGHRQGLTVAGFDADAKELAQIVDKQKKSLDSMGLALNTATQERDIAVDNANDLSASLVRAREAQTQAEGLSEAFRAKLRERGGLSLSIQNLAIRPLPSNAYEYVLDLMQVSPANRRASGKVEIHLVGDGQVLNVPMQNSSYNFENYQRLTGRWTMPNNFNPQYIEVYLRGGEGVVQRFAWQRGNQSIESSALLSEIPQTMANAN